MEIFEFCIEHLWCFVNNFYFTDVKVREKSQDSRNSKYFPKMSSLGANFSLRIRCEYAPDLLGDLNLLCDLWSLWCRLFTNVNKRLRLSQNICVYNGVKLLPRGICFRRPLMTTGYTPFYRGIWIKRTKLKRMAVIRCFISKKISLRTLYLGLSW